MKLKSYFADSIEQAIGLARREMGPDAMLVHSKRTASEAQHLGAYEVVCAADAVVPAERSPSQPPRSPSGSSVEKLVHEVSDLRHQMERLAHSLARCGPGMAALASDPALSQVFASLTEAELDPDLSYELVSGLSSPFAPAELRDRLAGLIRVDAEFARSGSVRSIAAFVGPPGAGKTSALVKLAVQRGIAMRRRTVMLSLDTCRVGAAEELQSYAAILGVACQVLESPSALPQALADHSQAGLILIDTPGLSSAEMDEGLARAIAELPDVDTHLVLPASMRSRDLRRAAARYSTFNPGKLLFTRLDETETFGPIFNQSARMAIPVSFLSSGQRIPEDIEPASTDRLLGLLLKSNQPNAAKLAGTVAA